MRRLWFAVVSAAAVCVAAPVASAQTPTGPTPTSPAAAPSYGEGRDPFEGTNRKIYKFNQKLDLKLLRPGVVFYHHAFPTPIRHGVHNMLTNLTGPIIFINDVLQVRPTNAAVTLSRFVINTTFGVGGIGDPAAKSGLDYHNADFGQTLGRYGVRSGPYIYIPVLGPSTVRDAFGRVVDGVADPFNSVNYESRTPLSLSRGVVGGIDARDQVDPILKDIDRTATDPYATIRSGYLQNREAAVRGEAVTERSVQALPDFAPAPSATPPQAPAPRR